MKHSIKQYTSKILTALLLVMLLIALVPAPQAASALAACDAAQFVADVTVPDGTSYAPNATFQKIWRLKNVGTCTWGAGYKVAFLNGTQMSASPIVQALPATVAPGYTVDVAVNLTAPASAGTYRGNWMLVNASSSYFGLGAYADKPFWVEIRVTGSPTAGYDFAANGASATWSSGAGSVAFNGSDPAAGGVAKYLAAPTLENNTVDGAGLLTVPQNVYNGYIMGVFPAVHVNAGDRFQSIVNCEYGASGCYVNFKLKYQIGSGPVNTLWSFAEAYEGLYYRANVDLSSLAGQDVKFILYTDTAGYATGDRPVWASPRIVSGGGAYPPPPPPPGPVPPFGTACDRAAFIDDVNYPDGSSVAPNAAFTKTWRIKNVGSCTWTTSYSLVFVSGNQMGGTSPLALTSTVGPNTSVDLSLNLTAPATAGNYRGYWMLKNQYGQAFGIGYYGDKAWWVDVNVSGSAPTATPTAGPTPTTGPTPTLTPTPIGGGASFNGDFTIDPDIASWFDSAGTITFGGTSSAGTVTKITGIDGVQGTTMEDETTSYRNSLLFVPNNGGYVRGIYPAYQVQSGDVFKATIGCQFGAHGCSVKYKIGYKVGGTITYFADQFTEAYDGMTRNVAISLNPIAGQTVQLVLEVEAQGDNTDDEAIWLWPRVE